MNWNIISVVFCNIFGSRQSDFAFCCEDLSYVQVPTRSKVKKLLIYTIAMEENDEKMECTDDQPSQLNVQQMDNTGEEDNGTCSQHENKDWQPEKGNPENLTDESLDSVPNRGRPKKCLRRTSDEKEPSDRHSKMVRFADSVGLDLTNVRHFTEEESDLPRSDRINKTFYNELSGQNEIRRIASRENLSTFQDDHQLVLEFEQPGGEEQFLERVHNQKICLENVIVCNLKVIGIVKILNLGFEKEVAVRYTLNEWMSFFEEKAEYLPGSSDGVTDKFSFSITPVYIAPGDRLIFVLRYTVNGQEFWDNNRNRNYTLRCQKSQIWSVSK
ncbi:protein phosphatase 1 regulatory subunit 3D [Caerostris darwini]|uniref:Protein phosphatase 1 regulatory subunit 3D n=1 Tax=Caerostris darwini TaxID=1538125 RepID=A0AAV4M8G6_9ARAC|nr:protein phosphatase 1 regulatory subunit 3D [Caerostris darwini]